MHAAAFTGDIKIMCLLIRCGGDLRLHDSKGQTPKDYALQIEKSLVRRRMLGFIEDVRKLACVNLNQLKATEDKYNM
jgi:hypothetical protein